jgi:hypothetical protein
MVIMLYKYDGLEFYHTSNTVAELVEFVRENNEEHVCDSDVKKLEIVGVYGVMPLPPILTDKVFDEAEKWTK